MKPWIKRSLAGLFGAALLFTGIGAVWAHRHAQGWRSMSEADIAQMKTRFVDRAASHLDLDAAQKQRLQVLADTVQAQHQALRGGTDPRAELQALVAGPSFDRAKALALLQDKTAAVQSQGPAVVTALADFWDGLNAQQQQKLRDMMDRRHER